MSTSRKTLFRGAVIDVGIDSVQLPNGVDAELEIVRHPGGSAVVAVSEAREVCLLRQYRHAAGGWLWELPAGKREPDEEPLETARRELADEAGVEAVHWHALGTLRSSPAVLTEKIHLWLACGLSPTETKLDEAEVLEVHWTPFERALELALTGTIEDAKTVIGLCRAAPLLRGVDPG